MKSIPGGGDALARGAKSQTFAMGGDSKDAPIELRNVAPEGTLDNAEIPALVDNSAFLQKKPTIFYAGEPLNDRILIKRVVRESNSSIIIPDCAKGKSDTGIVVSVSEKSVLDLQPGTLILFDKFAAVGQEVELLDDHGDKAEMLLVQECDVLLKLTPMQIVDTGNCVQ